MKTFDELLAKAKQRGYKSFLTAEAHKHEAVRFRDGILLYPQKSETLLLAYWVQVHSKPRVDIPLADKLIVDITDPQWQELTNQLFDLLDEWPVIDKI